MGASRLPGKVLLTVQDKTILEHVVARVSRAATVSTVVIATTVGEGDLPIVDLARSLDIDVFCGSENDVLDRYYRAAKRFEAAHIIRITADCPLIDPGIVDLVVREYFTKKADYCSNILEETFPDGEDVEVFSSEALETAWTQAELLSEREHVTPYIRNHPEMFSLVNVRNPEDLSAMRWTLDEPEDLEFIRAVLERLLPRGDEYSMADVIALLRENPEIAELNSGIRRNEGYAKSLANDRTVPTARKEER